MLKAILKETIYGELHVRVDETIYYLHTNKPYPTKWLRSSRVDVFRKGVELVIKDMSKDLVTGRYVFLLPDGNQVYISANRFPDIFEFGDRLRDQVFLNELEGKIEKNLARVAYYKTQIKDIKDRISCQTD